MLLEKFRFYRTGSVSLLWNIIDSGNIYRDRGQAHTVSQQSCFFKPEMSKEALEEC